jgi:secreted trypsin-like serine protease
MNLTDLESSFHIDAKICGSMKSRKIAYSIMDFHHSIYINKKDIIFAQISACEQLYKYTADIFDSSVLKKEISDLKFILDLLE